MTLEVQLLNKVFATGAAGGIGIKDVSFRLAPGTFFTLLGPSGCGKTTTLRSVAGLQEPDSGTITVGNRTFYDGGRGISVPLNERGIGMVFQSYAIWPHMTVAENVSFPLRVGPGPRLARSDILARVKRALAAVALDEQIDRPATRLSGGQQQRVALARAIVAEPELLLLDEPLSNLDAALRDRTRAELKRLQQQLGVTTVYVTHDQAEALEMSDEIAVMHAGRIVQVGPPRDIYFRPVNRFVATFIGSTNLLPGTVPEAVAAGAIGTMHLANGQPVRGVFPAAQASGSAVELSVRPESIEVVSAVDGTGPETNLLTGRVVTCGFIGPMNRYEIDCAGTVLQATTKPDLNLPLGSEATLRFPVRAAAAVSA